MTTEVAQAQVRKLEGIRNQIRWWRSITSIVLFSMVAIGIAAMYNSAQGLMQKGPRQDEYMSVLSAGLKRDVMPDLQNMASRTMSETEPIVRLAFVKLNDRVPELSKETFHQLNLLQTEIPKNGEALLRSELDGALQARKTKIRAMFPNASDDKVNQLFTNLTAEANVQASTVSAELFSTPVAQIDQIKKNMAAIQQSETVVPGEQANWEMGLAIFDVFRDDMKDLATAEPKTSTNAPASAPKADAGKGTK